MEARQMDGSDGVPSITFREATIDDAKILFDWRNDELTRAMSRSPDLVEWDNHLSWLNNRLNRIEPHLYIVVVEDEPVGTFRIDHGDEVSYTIAPAKRRKGFGLAMLHMVRAKFGPLRAEIFERNIASLEIAKKAGLTAHVM
jgi:RimJ/RimL family protein N-acetyltransferase